MKKAQTVLENLLSWTAGCALATSSSLAAGYWDSGFPAFPSGALDDWSRIGPMTCLNGKLYVAVNRDYTGPTAQLYVYNGTNWSSVVNGVTDDGSVYALSGATTTSSGDRLFVGGSFTWVGSGALEADYIAMLNPNPVNNPAWSYLGGAQRHGTDGGVRCISAVRMYTPTPPDWFAVYMGGGFTEAGSVTGRGVARWNSSGGGTWSSLGSGLAEVLPGQSWQARGIAASVVGGSDGASHLLCVYVAGLFKKTVNGTATYNAARWDGVSWNYIGTGLWDGAFQLPNCDLVLYQSGYEAVGNCTVIKPGDSTSAWVGGWMQAAVNARGSKSMCPFYVPGQTCSNLYHLCAAYVDTSYNSYGLKTGCGFKDGQTASMAVCRGKTYAIGTFHDPNSGIAYYKGILDNAGVLELTGGPTDVLLSCAADSTSVYFSDGLTVYRYVAP